MKIFVPGRLCLFGEHSDWAGGYRRQNPMLEKGYTLIVGTNQGLYAEVKPHPTHLILQATLNDGTRLDRFSLPMDANTLRQEAEKGDFFSYVAGVAYQFLTHFGVGGLEIDNYFTDLPIQKGLSSSAALCVLVARAFNRIYDLKMTLRGEMEFAYQGEITTPSRCGRMDQACAYGNRPILMVFDGDRIDITELTISQDLFFVIVDLGASKNTQEILQQLNHCYPYAADSIQTHVQHYLGCISAQITQEAVAALQQGNAERIGELMNLAQAEFDRHLIPACPSELTAPILHQLLNYSPIQPYIFGGKGVGSQGDGTAQLIVKDAVTQQQVMEIIENDFPQMQCLKLTIPSSRKVRKAVIPAAGFGTRMFPVTKVVKKELLPIIDRDGRAKPIILAIVEEALSAGIEEVGIVVQASSRKVFEDFFSAPPSPELFNKLNQVNQEYCQYLQAIGNKITLLTQDSQEGFGHAVFCAAEWVNQEPFLLMLGDHLYTSESERSCASQLLEVYQSQGKSVIGLRITPGELIHHYGCIAGEFAEGDRLLQVTKIYEKPSLDYARQYLHVKTMDENLFFSVFGMYVLQPKIFEYLKENIKANAREKGEFQLTSCLDQLREEEGTIGYLVKGQCFDTGLPEIYRQTVKDFGLLS